MTAKEPARPVIVVALDASPASVAAAEAAAQIAEFLGAELQGLFVEDLVMARLGELAAVRVVNPSGITRPFGRMDVQRQLRRQHDNALHALRAAATRHNLRWTFASVRGSVVEELVKAAAAAELLIAGRCGWSMPGRAGLGSIARALVEQSPKPVLLVERDCYIRQVIGVIDDGSDAAWDALELAAVLARGPNRRVAVLALPAAATTARMARRREFFEARSVAAGVALLADAEARTIRLTLRRLGASLVVLCAALDGFRRLVEQSDCPVLLVR